MSFTLYYTNKKSALKNNSFKKFIMVLELYAAYSCCPILLSSLEWLQQTRCDPQIFLQKEKLGYMVYVKMTIYPYFIACSIPFFF